jgi:hypothetical protein
LGILITSTQSDWNASRLLRLNTFNFTIIGSLELADGYLVFDTDKAELFGDFNLEGVLSKTDDGTTVAVFNFMTIYLGKGVKVRFQGSNAVVIMSRSSVIIDTELQVRPGTLGGFPGGGFVGTGTRNNNLNGPGSTNSRVYVKTLSTFGSHIPEIQEIETSCTPGQKIQGHFQLSYGYDSSRKTQLIPFDATADDVKRYLETAFKKIGSLHVERVNGGNEFAQVGRKWIVTFLSAVGNVPQLKATSRLTGLGSKVETRTIREGNEISGTFTLKFLNNESRAMPHDISSIALRKVLLTDFPFLLDARVERTDSTQSCLQGSTIPSQTGPSTISGASYEEFKPKEWLVPNEKLFETSGESYKNYEDKLCSNGRGAAGGFVWKLQFWTKDGNMVSTSTTSPQKDVTLPCEPMIVTPTLVGAGAIAEVVDSMCFSLAFGGAGASYAAQGGFGYSSSPHGSFGTQYSTVQVQDLIGGSGGAGGGMDPIDIFPVVQPTLGGAGGGAIMLTAVNDILIGSNGKITANGAPGRPGFTAGGGGSGGTILITSGATIAHHGIFESIGGDGGNSWPVNRAPFAMPGGGGSGGRIAIYAQSYSSWGEGQVRLNGGKQGSIQPTSVPALVNPEDGAAGAGSFYVEMQTNLGIRVDPTIGAAGTSKSLLIDGVESYESGSTGVLHAPSNQYARSGPRYVLRSSRVNFTISTPSRITYFVRMGNLANGEISKARGALFGVHDVPLSLDNINNLQGQEENKNRMMISIGLVDGNFMHEANTHQFPRQLLMEKIQLNRWYKVDLFLNWPKKTYSIQLNDVIKVSNVPFVGKGVDSISLSNFHQMSTWWDEIYVGYNHLMGFVCPTMTSSSSDTTSRVLSTRTRRRKLWSINALGSNVTTFHEKVLHESHLSKQEKYKYDPNTGKNAMGMLQFDGESHRDFFYDIRERETEEDPIKKEMEEIFFAEFLEMDQQSQDASIIMPFEPISKSSSTIYWYSEVFEEDSSNSTSGTGFLNGTVMGKGAIGACSTRDYNEWRNEGLMIHFINLTDPFGKNIGGNLLADRPKVIYNQDTNQFVMWMHVDNATNTMGLSGVAVSSFPNGPFQFQRSFYPDAPLEAPGGRSINETHDQTIAMLEKKAFLIRTYYKTVEYWLPRSVMNPLWESVKNEDGSVNFGLSYHRAFYHEGYDDPNDIYLQRWRMEDRPWEVLCCQETQMSDCKLINDLPGNHSASLDVENPLENLFKTRN